MDQVEEALSALGGLTGSPPPSLAALTPAAVVSSAPAPARAGRLAMTAVLPGAIVVTLVRPVSWALGLAGFLAGGGLLLVAWPILVLPTPTGLQNALGGPLSTLVFGRAVDRDGAR